MTNPNTDKRVVEALRTYFPQQVARKKSTASKNTNKKQLKAKGHG